MHLFTPARSARSQPKPALRFRGAVLPSNWWAHLDSNLCKMAEREGFDPFCRLEAKSRAFADFVNG
jgi:hypothetical protein